MFFRFDVNGPKTNSMFRILNEYSLIFPDCLFRGNTIYAERRRYVRLVEITPVYSEIDASRA